MVSSIPFSVVWFLDVCEEMNVMSVVDTNPLGRCEFRERRLSVGWGD